MNSIDMITRSAKHQQPTPTPPPQGWHDEPPPESPLVLVVGGAMVMLTWALVALCLMLVAW